MNIPSWVYTLPYIEGGRNEDGVDCWGLIVVLYKHYYNTYLDEHATVTLPSIKECEGVSKILQRELAKQTQFYQVDSAQFGDVILINVLGNPLHIGFCLDDSTMIHTGESHGVCIEKFTEMKWKTKIAGIYRKK